MRKILFVITFAILSTSLFAVEYIKENPTARMRNYTLSIDMPIVKGRKQEKANEILMNIKRYIYARETGFWAWMKSYVDEIENRPFVISNIDGSVFAPARVESCRVVARYDIKGNYLGAVIFIDLWNTTANFGARIIYEFDTEDKNIAKRYVFNGFNENGRMLTVILNNEGIFSGIREPRYNDNLLEKFGSLR